jgi:hypothetical protein
MIVYMYVYMLARTIVRDMSAIIEKFRNPQTFLSETCSQCRNNDGNFNHDNCFDPVDPNTNFTERPTTRNVGRNIPTTVG